MWGGAPWENKMDARRRFFFWTLLSPSYDFHFNYPQSGGNANDFCPFPPSRSGWSLPQTPPWTAAALSGHSLPPNLQHLRPSLSHGPSLLALSSVTPLFTPSDCAVI